MKISELKNGVKQLAEKRRSERHGGESKQDNLVVAFDWSVYGESVMWSDVFCGNYSSYENLYPNHEWTKYYPGEYFITNNNFIIDLNLTKYTENQGVSASILADGYFAGEGVSQKEKDAWKKGFIYYMRHCTGSNNLEKHTTNIDTWEIKTDAGIKEEDGKISYELDWEFIEAMAARMTTNKDKYPAYNWHKPIDEEKLKQSLTRHLVEIMKGNYKDDEDNYGHVVAIALNSMMLFYQLNHNKKILKNE